MGGGGGGVRQGGGTDCSRVFTIFHIFHRFFTDSKPHAGTGTDFSHMPSTKTTLKSQKCFLTSAPVITTIPGYNARPKSNLGRRCPFSFKGPHNEGEPKPLKNEYGLNPKPSIGIGPTSCHVQISGIAFGVGVGGGGDLAPIPPPKTPNP